MNRMDWNELAILLEYDPLFAERVMHHPAFMCEPCKDLFDRLETVAESHGLGTLFRRFAFSAMLLSRLGWKIFDNDAFPLHGVPIETKRILQGKWIAFPMLLCRKDSCVVHWAMAGLLPEQGSVITGTEFDFQASTALKHAASLFLSMHPSFAGRLIFWSLTSGDERIITGNSLGLPALLALEFLWSEREWPSSLYATGGMDSTGAPLPSGNLMEKQDCAELRGALLITLSEDAVKRDNVIDNVIACSTISLAVEAADSVAEGAGQDDILLCSACMRNPHIFFEQFEKVPSHLLQTDLFKQLRGKIKEEPIRYLNYFASCLDRVACNIESAAHVCGFFSLDDIMNTCSCSKEAAIHALHAVTSIIMFLNHTGNTSDIVPYLEAVEMLRDLAGHDAVAHYLNHRFVAERHNRFHFEPTLPDEFSRFLDIEEQIARLKGEGSWLLGAMYGTIAQNFGFCGPKWKHEAERHADLASKAFCHRYRKDVMRLLNYMVYINLDAMQYEDAASYLASYLNVATDRLQDAVSDMLQDEFDMKHGEESNKGFMLACSLRFIADTGYFSLTKYQIQRILILTDRYWWHPWQLSAFNAGRIALVSGLGDVARRLLRRSMEICMNGGSTMKAMALLPLAFMYSNDMLVHDDMKQIDEIRSIISSPDLIDVSWFSALCSACTTEEILQLVASNPMRWFPFSYR